MSNDHYEINKKLYDLLKEPLQLHDKVTRIVLTIDVDNFPKVEQTYWIENCEIQTQLKTINEYNN